MTLDARSDRASGEAQRWRMAGNGGDDSGEVWFERRKWPDTPHYGHPAWLLGTDDLGVWFEVRLGVPWYRGDTFLFDGPFDAVVLVSALGGFIAWFWPEGRELDLYVDIVTNVQHSRSTLIAVDLDLDVIRHRDDGRVELVDEDEFAAHQVELDYPQSVIDHANRVARTVLASMLAGDAPFDGAAASRWCAVAAFGQQDRRSPRSLH